MYQRVLSLFCPIRGAFWLYKVDNATNSRLRFEYDSFLPHLLHFTLPESSFVQVWLEYNVYSFIFIKFHSSFYNEVLSPYSSQACRSHTMTYVASLALRANLDRLHFFYLLSRLSTLSMPTPVSWWRSHISPSEYFPLNEFQYFFSGPSL